MLDIISRPTSCRKDLNHNDAESADQEMDSNNLFERNLMFWPFSQNSLLDVANKELVEEHAYFLLSRALNIGRLVAVIGAGASASYGRTSWSELADRISRGELDKAKEFLKRHPSTDVIKAIADQLEQLRNDPEADNYTLFQVADRLGKKIHLVKLKLNPAGEPPSASGRLKSMRQEVADLTANDQGHLRNLLNTLAPGSNQRFVEGAKPRPILWKHVDQDLIPKEIRGHDNEPIPPYLRVAFAMRTNKSTPESNIERAEAYLNHCNSEYIEGSFDRNLIIGRSRDPLMWILRTLRNRKFLTTNFDSEIERLLRDEGFRTNPGQKSEWITETAEIDPTAALADILVFNQHQVGALTAFAAQDRSSSASVVYLHGRADRDENIESLVLSEEDYQQRYASDLAKKVAVEEAVSLAFGTSPLLFVGLGMTEDDVLRQLRLLSSSPKRLFDRHCIALMPAWSKKKADRERLKLLQKYGVYTIHFGILALEDKPIYWLENLDAFNKYWKSKCNGKVVTQSDFDQTVKTLGDGDIRLLLQDHLKPINISVELSLLTRFLSGEIDANENNVYLFSNLMDAFLNAFVCKSLEVIDSKLSDWRTNWLALPDAATLPFAGVPHEVDDCRYEILTRHASDLPRYASREFRFHVGIPSPTFEAFLTILRENTSHRKFVVQASRGTGRGHFSSALVARAAQALCALSLKMPKKVYFASITHSTEVFSIFDQFASFLTDQGAPTNFDRIGRLEHAVVSNNFLFILNGAHVLFDPHGNPKNSQIGRIFSALAKSHGVVFLLSSDELNQPFNRVNLPPNEVNQVPSKASQYPFDSAQNPQTQFWNEFKAH